LLFENNNTTHRNVIMTPALYGNPLSSLIVMKKKHEKKHEKIENWELGTGMGE